MSTSQSIRVRLSRSYFIFFMLVVLLGGISVGMISYENSVSSEIRDRWLQNTMLIGDFENFTSDYRSDEGSALLSPTPEAIEAEDREMARLDKLIIQTELRFEQIPHDKEETALFRQFTKQWEDYKSSKTRVFAAYHSGDRSNARLLFQTESKDNYSAASITLEKLRKYNIKEVSAASIRSETTNYNVLWLIGLAVIITDILAFAASVHVRRSIFNPLMELIGAMRSLAQNQTDIKVDGINRTDEIGEMARAVILFRENILNLAESKAQLEHQAIVLQKNLEAEKELTLHQRNFVSMASHEFRTPLNVIDGQAQRLLRHKSDIAASEIETRTGAIRAAVLRMTSMIDTLLEVTRLVDGENQLVPQIASVNIIDVLHEVCHQHREIAPHATINENFESSPLICLADYKLIFQAFSNVIGNSVKYSTHDTVIDIKIIRDFESVSIIFSDCGIGIRQDDIPKIFKRYFRGGNVSGIVGTGLGLYLVKTVIDLHGGDICIESTEGVGTQISIRLPYNATSDEQAGN